MPNVIFDVAEFKSRFPSLAERSAEELEGYFDMSTSIVNNSDDSEIPFLPPYDKTRKNALYALVCHYATLAMRGMGVTGAMSGATEGSVSINYSHLPMMNGTAAWYNQTQCGAMAYQILLPFSLGGRSYVKCDN